MAATVPVEREGDVSPLLQDALRIGEPPDETEQSADQPAAVVDPKPGTFEAFMGSFGTPARWAGR